MLLAVAASIFSFAVDNGVDPYARQRARELVSAARADLLSLVVQEGTFRKIDDGLFIQIGERLPDGRLGGIFVADSRRPKASTSSTTPSTASVRRTRREERADDERRRDSSQGRRRATSRSSASPPMPSTCRPSASAASEVCCSPRTGRCGFLLNPDPNDPMYKPNPQQFRAELHRRFTEWVYPDRVCADRAGGGRRRALASRGAHPPAGHGHDDCAVRALARLLRRQPGPDRRPLLVPLVYARAASASPRCRVMVHLTNRDDGTACRLGRRDLVGFVRRIGERMMLFAIALLRPPGASARGRA